VELGQRVIADLEDAAEKTAARGKRSAQRTKRASTLRSLAATWRELIQFLPFLVSDCDEFNRRHSPVE
jgi:hypothetical protein